MKNDRTAAYHSGTLAISPAEHEALIYNSADVYTQHPKFTGVSFADIPMTSLPRAVRELIAEQGGTPTSLAAVRAVEIPEHVHATDAEIYFSGDFGTVTLFDEAGEKIDEVPLSAEVFTLTLPGEGHALRADARATAHLYAAKFTINP